MAELIVSDEFRAVIFAIVSAVFLVAWRHEVRLSAGTVAADTHERSPIWPTFWLGCGAIFGVLALAQVIGLGELIGDLGRRSASADGWYESRRPLQALAVLTISIGWAVIVAGWIWRIPERRRRYLPTALLLTTICAFAAVRAISLHHIDSLFFRFQPLGVRFGVIVEYALLALAVVAVRIAVARPVPSRTADVAVPAR